MKLEIQYCGGWGYGKYAKALQKYLISELGNDKLQFILKEDKGTTGNFEVKADGKLLHSKANGAGKCTSTDEKTKLLNKIKSLI